MVRFVSGRGNSHSPTPSDLNSEKSFNETLLSKKSSISSFNSTDTNLSSESSVFSKKSSYSTDPSTPGYQQENNGLHLTQSAVSRKDKPATRRSQFYKPANEADIKKAGLADKGNYGYEKIVTSQYPDGKWHFVEYYNPEKHNAQEADAPNDSPVDIPMGTNVWADDVKPSEKKKQVEEITLRGGDDAAPLGSTSFSSYVKDHPHKSVLIGLGVAAVATGLSVAIAQVVQEIKHADENNEEAKKTVARKKFIKENPDSQIPDHLKSTVKKDEQKKGPVNPWSDRLSKYT